LQTIFPGDAPGFLVGAPFGYNDVELIKGHLESAGFSLVSAAIVDDESTAPSVRHAAVALCQGTPLRTGIEARSPGEIEKVTGQVAEKLAAQFGTGPVSGKTRGIVVTAT